VPGWRQLRGDLKRGTAAAVIFCDLDHLKYFNYENAPSLGDELLRRAAAILSSRSEHAGTAIDATPTGLAATSS